MVGGMDAVRYGTALGNELTVLAIFVDTIKLVPPTMRVCLSKPTTVATALVLLEQVVHFYLFFNTPRQHAHTYTHTTVCCKGYRECKVPPMTRGSY